MAISERDIQRIAKAVVEEMRKPAPKPFSKAELSRLASEAAKTGKSKALSEYLRLHSKEILS